MANRSTPDPRALAKLLPILREHRVKRMRYGDLEIELAPALPVAAQVKDASSTEVIEKARALRSGKGVDDFIAQRYGASLRPGNNRVVKGGTSDA